MIVLGGPPSLDIELVPDSSPVIVPKGGSFTFTGSLTNLLGDPQTADAWIMIELPGGSLYGPVMKIENIPLGAYQEIERSLEQNVPSNAPVGTYDYIGRCGNYPDLIIDESSFEVTVTE